MGAFLHRLAHQLAHLRQLFGVGLHVVLAEHVLAHGAGADERGHIGRDAAGLELFQVLAERGPVDVVADIRLRAQGILLHGIVERAHGHLAHDLQRHALAQVAQRSAIGQERFLRMRQHVDETGGHGLARGIDLGLALARRMWSDEHDAIALDGHIAPVRLGARAVVDRAATDHRVVRGRGPGRQRHPRRNADAGETAHGRAHTAPAQRCVRVHRPSPC